MVRSAFRQRETVHPSPRKKPVRVLPAHFHQAGTVACSVLTRIELPRVIELAYARAALICAGRSEGKDFKIFLSCSPVASISKTCHTIIRVPLKVGLPWQIFGSATMCLL